MVGRLTVWFCSDTDLTSQARPDDVAASVERDRAFGAARGRSLSIPIEVACAEYQLDAIFDTRGFCDTFPGRFPVV